MLRLNLPWRYRALPAIASDLRRSPELVRQLETTHLLLTGYVVFDIMNVSHREEQAIAFYLVYASLLPLGYRVLYHTS